MARREKVLIGVLIGLMVANSVLVFLWLRERNHKAESQATVNTNEQSSTAELTTTKPAGVNTQESGGTTSTVSSQETITKDESGVAWIEPIELTDLGIIREIAPEGALLVSAKYFRVANLDDGGQIILAQTYGQGPGLYNLLRFRKNKEGTYYFLKKNSVYDSQDESGILKSFVDSVKIDDSTSYASLIYPDSILVKQAQLSLLDASTSVLYSNYGKVDYLPKAAEKISDTGNGTLYKSFSESGEKASRTIFLRLADDSVVNYSLKVPFIADDKVPNITLLNGQKNMTKYEYVTEMCGTPQTSVVDNLSNLDQRIEQIGVAHTGEKIYKFKSSDDPMIKDLYETYRNGRENPISLQEFASGNSVITWQDQLSDYEIMMISDYAPLGECGKPVIYLYPEKPIEVSVKVGANITKSDPNYGDGWKVLANPNGELLLGGKSYPYLYWEGQGREYPAINSGFVVANKDIEFTLRNHLKQLGLNAQESDDFLKFWLPKMPETPYIRLTWFGNEALDRLAPLSVSPKPETVIRVFLDFKGLNKPINIKPQILSAPERKGFTLVEWGGLLVGGNVNEKN